MHKEPKQQKSVREYVLGLSVWAKIGWTVVLGYIVGRILYWSYKLLS